jgi:hypothetical protein
MIDWNKAPEWANTALTTSHNWQGSRSDIGNIEFVICEGNDYWAGQDKDQQFTISNDYWEVVERRPVKHETLTGRVSNNKYERELTDRFSNTCIIDVYDVLVAFNVTCPAIQHAVKKLLCTGIRGHKDSAQDLIEAKESIARAIELAANS